MNRTKPHRTAPTLLFIILWKKEKKISGKERKKGIFNKEKINLKTEKINKISHHRNNIQ